MDINIRKSVLKNLSGSSFDALYNTINDATSVEEENVLPGLGVMFDVLWKQSNDNQKRLIVDLISDALK